MEDVQAWIQEPQLGRSLGETFQGTNVRVKCQPQVGQIMRTATTYQVWEVLKLYMPAHTRRPLHSSEKASREGLGRAW